MPESSEEAFEGFGFLCSFKANSADRGRAENIKGKLIFRKIENMQL